MLYELRLYDATPGNLPAVNDRFGNHVVGFFKKYGIGILGFWTEEIGTSNRLTFILSYEDMGDRERKWREFASDPDWRKVQAETEAGGPLAATVQNTFMRLTSYSPEPKISSNLQELRIYDAVPGKLQALHDRFANHTTGFFKKYDIDVIGYWTDEIGVSNRLTYLVGHESLAKREENWRAFSADPDWQKAVAESHRDGVLVRQSRNTILRPTPYSPR
jgi:hypothetical protein